MITQSVGPAVLRLSHKGVIRKEREKLDVSQKNFAKMIGVSTVTLRRWESGKKKPGTERALNIYQVLRALKVSKELQF